MELTAELLSGFSDSFPRRFDEVAAALKTARERHSEAEPRELLRSLSHRMAGSALSYGFHDVGLAAQHLETLAGKMGQGQHLDPALNAALDRLRRAVADARRSPRPIDEAGPVSERDKSVPRPVVMVVDDDQAHTALIVVHLRSLGFEAHGFTEPDEAIAQVAALQPQCLLLDVIFPGEGDAGFMLSQQLLARVALPPTVIFLTAREDLSARRKASALGAHAYISKPVNLTTLATILEHQFSTGRLSRPRVLLVEDSDPVSRLYSLLLRKAGIEATAVRDPLEVLDAIYLFQPDLVLLDLNLPGIAGAEICALLRQHETLFDLPVMGLTGETNPLVLKRALQAGLDGILHKDDDLSGLIPLIRARVERYRRVRHAMMRDMLTGLMNRAALLERLSLELHRGHRAGKPLCLAIIDIDHFKDVNDRHGHIVGDAALKHVAQQLRSRLRSVDFAGRLGGDEFLVVMPHTDLADAAGVLEEITVRVRELPFEHGAIRLQVTLSTGLAESNPDDPLAERSKISALMGRADDLLYEAKRQGRDRVMWQPSGSALAEPDTAPTFDAPGHGTSGTPPGVDAASL